MRLLHCLSLIFVVSTATGTAAWAQASVEGAVTYDAQKVAMTQVYARETRGSASRSEPPQVLILVTDRAAPAQVIASRQAYYDAARAGEIRGFLLTLDPDVTAKPRFAIFAPGGGYDDTFVPDIFEKIDLTGLKREGGFVSGRLRTAEPRDFTLDAGTPDRPATYALDVKFRVPITPAPQPKAVLTGEAARSSEQAAAALRALQLINSGSIAELKAMVVPGHPAFDGLEGPEGKANLAIARRVLPKPATFRQSVERVVVYDTESTVVSRDKDGATSVTLRRVGDQWKMAPSPMPND